jgi:hypothetical protein
MKQIQKSRKTIYGVYFEHAHLKSKAHTVYHVSGLIFWMKFERGGVAVPLGLETTPTPRVEHRQA